MKFDEFEKQIENNRAEHRRIETFAQWEWSLGHSRRPDISRTVVFEYRPIFSNGAQLRITERGRGYGEQLDLSRMLEHLSPTQWAQVAEIAATIDRWKAGEIDDLPPSGPWKTNR